MYFLAMMLMKYFRFFSDRQLMLPTWDSLGYFGYYVNYVPGIHTSILNSEMDTYSSMKICFLCNLCNCPYILFSTLISVLRRQLCWPSVLAVIQQSPSCCAYYHSCSIWQSYEGWMLYLKAAIVSFALRKAVPLWNLWPKYLDGCCINKYWI